MGKPGLEDRKIECQWASDVSFDGVRLEVFSDEGDMLFDVSVPDQGQITINTFGREASADLIMAAIEIARRAP